MHPTMLWPLPDGSSQSQKSFFHAFPSVGDDVEKVSHAGRKLLQKCRLVQRERGQSKIMTNILFATINSQGNGDTKVCAKARATVHATTIHLMCACGSTLGRSSATQLHAASLRGSLPNKKILTRVATEALRAPHPGIRIPGIPGARCRKEPPELAPVRLGHSERRPRAVGPLKFG